MFAMREPAAVAQQRDPRGRRLASADELDDLEDVAFGKGCPGVVRLGEDLAVALDGHAGRGDSEPSQQVGHRGAGGQSHRLAVDRDRELGRHFLLIAYWISELALPPVTRITAAAVPFGKVGIMNETKHEPSDAVLPWKAVAG